MILIIKGLTGISIKRVHEFANVKRPKMIRLNFLFWSVYVFDGASQVKYITILRAALGAYFKDRGIFQGLLIANIFRVRLPVQQVWLDQSV